MVLSLCRFWKRKAGNMGCDIHIVLERKKRQGGDWIGVYCTDDLPGSGPLIARRDYEFFGEVANVRCRGTHYPRNVPEDVSRLAWQSYMSAPTDHHSASHMTVSEFCSSWFKVHGDGLTRLPNRDPPRVEFGAYDLLGIDEEDDYEYRVVFWFDN